MQLDKALLTGDEEYDDVHDIDEYLVAQELAEQEEALVQSENGYRPLHGSPKMKLKLS